MKSSAAFSCLLLLAISLIAASPALATTGGEFTFVSRQFSLHPVYTYGSPALDRKKYIDDGYLTYKYASFLYNKQLFDRSFREQYGEQPLSIDFSVDVGDEYREFRKPADWDTNPYVLRHVDQVRALPVPKIYTLQLVIYESEKWLEAFKTTFGQKLKQVDVQELCHNVRFSSFVDGGDEKKHPAYVITIQAGDGRLTYYVRYGVFISLDDARNVAEGFGQVLGFEVQILERPLSKELIRKTLFDRSFVL
jgi:hypothetical protein